MIYIIAILLLILVLSNDTARGLLGALLVGATKLAIIAAILFVIVVFGVWLFTSNTGETIFIGVIITGIIAFIVFDQYKIRKK